MKFTVIFKSGHTEKFLSSGIEFRETAGEISFVTFKEPYASRGFEYINMDQVAAITSEK